MPAPSARLRHVTSTAVVTVTMTAPLMAEQLSIVLQAARLARANLQIQMSVPVT